MGERGHLGSKADFNQKVKEYKWIAYNITEAKTPEQEKKWRTKMDNWRKANPRYAEKVDELLAEELKKRVEGMTPEQREAYVIELEEELERREKVMKDE